MTSFSEQPQGFTRGSLKGSSSSKRTLFNNVMNGVIFLCGLLALLAFGAGAFLLADQRFQ